VLRAVLLLELPRPEPLLLELLLEVLPPPVLLRPEPLLLEPPLEVLPPPVLPLPVLLPLEVLPPPVLLPPLLSPHQVLHYQLPDARYQPHLRLTSRYQDQHLLAVHRIHHPLEARP
jgi:hypothetical protein